MNSILRKRARPWCFLLLAMLFCGQTIAQPPNQSLADNQLKSFLREYLDIASDPPDWLTYYKDVQVDLNHDGTAEVIVYIVGRGWCGSGGCTLLILQRAGASFKVVGRTTITNPPITVLPERHHGWQGIGVLVRGGGIPGYEAELRFDGKTFPSNPSVPPARPRSKGRKGQIVIADSRLDEMSTL